MSKVVPESINNHSIVPDFSQVLEVPTSESEDYSDSGEEEKEPRKNYRSEKCETAVDNSVRISKNGPTLRKRSPRELILRSGSTYQLNKRMKFSSRDDASKSDILSEQKISAVKFSLPRKNDYKDKLALDILEISNSDSEDGDANEDREKNNNDPQEVQNDGQTDHEELVRDQCVEGRLPKEGICGGDKSLEPETQECSAKHPPADILPL